MHLRPFAMATMPGMLLWIKKQRNQTVRVTVCLKDHIATPPAIPAIRSSLGDIFLAAETATPIPSIAGSNMDHDSINKFSNFHDDVTLLKKKSGCKRPLDTTLRQGTLATTLDPSTIRQIKRRLLAPQP
jgi:hypothetical protein